MRLKNFLRMGPFLMRSIQTNKKHIIPGFGFSMTVTLVMLSILIIIPLASVLTSAVKLGPIRLITLISDELVRSAFATSLLFSFLAAFINSVFGTLLAWILVRYEFPGRHILDGMIELPFAMPTAVAGITLSKMYSTTGEPGRFLSKFGINISYTRAGILVALIFVGIPFTVRTVMPVLEKLNSAYEEAAYTLGAGTIQTIRRVILPELYPAILTGFSLAFARGIGEYGSVIYISGNSAREHTQVISYIIMQKLNYMDYESATAIAFVMLMISFAILFVVNSLQIWQSKRASGTGETVSVVHSDAIKESRIIKGILILVGVVFVVIMLLLPLFYVIVNSLSKGIGFYIGSITTDYVYSAFVVTFFSTVITLVVNTGFGLASSWLLTRYDFFGKRILAALIDIPFSISPVIAGLSYIMMFGRLGWAYPAITLINNTFGTDIQIVFALPGVVLATIFVTFPFVSREIVPVLNSSGCDEEEAAAMTGAGGFTIFRRITLPHIKWALIYGIILCTARALGEFGAVNALSKTRGKTFTIPLEIDALYMSGNADSITSAFCVSSVLVIIAIIILILRSIFEYREKKLCTSN